MTYHYRVVATNSTGTSYGDDQSFSTLPAVLTPIPASPALVGVPSLPPATRPVLGRSATVAAVSGTVMVELPGADTYLPLDRPSTVPVGSTIDASKGRIRLTNVRDGSGKLQTGTFWGGSFTIHQTRTKRALTVMTLAPPTCTKARQLASASANAPRVRNLWAHDNHGRFVTRGHSAIATVRGTTWLTQERCNGTLVKVSQGSVSVRDLVRHRTVIVSAGQSYLARKR
jgi:hypothetical protein